MKQTLRALGWATTIFWIFLIAFAGTCVYSAANTRIKLGEPQVFPSETAITISFPLFINNSGYYDISDLNVTTLLEDIDGVCVSKSTTIITLVPKGRNIVKTHNITINLNDIAYNFYYYLFNDTEFNLQQHFKLKFARVIPFHALANMKIPWGAPLYNFSVKQVSYQCSYLTNCTVTVSFAFENHSPYFDVIGKLRLEIYNSNGEQIGIGETTADAPSHSSFEGTVDIVVDGEKFTAQGEIFFYFETPLFNFGPLVIPYG